MLAFLLSTVAISLSGVMAPGPITAATLAAGARSRHAGATIALGHAVVEMPLILLLVVGVGRLLESGPVKIGIGIAGGIVLLAMGVQLLLSTRDGGADTGVVPRHSPFASGILLTAANPYFLVWWATVGLALATRAVEFGAAMLALFALVHWLCDLVWLEALSLASFQGTRAFGARAQRAISLVCAAMLLGFGLKFVLDAALAFGGRAG